MAREKPIVLCYRSLNRAAKFYDTTHSEFLAFIQALRILRPYVYERCFTIRTDHDAPWSILNMADKTGKLTRCRLMREGHELDVVHLVCIETPNVRRYFDTWYTGRRPDGTKWLSTQIYIWSVYDAWSDRYGMNHTRWNMGNDACNDRIHDDTYRRTGYPINRTVYPASIRLIVLP